MKLLCCSKILFFLFLITLNLFGSLNSKSAVFYFEDKISYPMVGIHNYIVVEPSKTNIYTHGFKLYNDKIYAKITNINEINKLLQQGFKNFYLHKIPLTKKNIQKVSQYQNNKFIIDIDSQQDLTTFPSNIKAVVIQNFDPQHYSQLEKKLQKHKLDLIDIHFLDGFLIADLVSSMNKMKKKLQSHNYKHIIPIYTTPEFDIYGVSTKNAIKREIFVLIDEKKEVRNTQSAHIYGAMPLEYQGYMQQLYDINNGLPTYRKMLHYAGIIVWLNRNYPKPNQLTSWVLKLNSLGIKTAYAENFGAEMDNSFLEKLGITIEEPSPKATDLKIIHKDPMIGFETKPLLSGIELYLHVRDAQPLLTVEDNEGGRSVLAAITPWGGYVTYNSLMLEYRNQNIWIIDPFKFFKQALRLPTIPVPDPTTENGTRIFFSHVDGDGIMNEAEFNPDLFSGDTIYSNILKKYEVPHSISVIGAEIMPNGLYPELSPRLLKLAKKIFALPNVEPATHTFTHTFFWGKIKNGTLSEKYRLKPKGYKFSLPYEIKGMLDYINKNLLSSTKEPRAQTVFWSGDCMPRENALDVVYRNNFLNINGGDTTISNAEPYVGNVAPLGLKRDEYYQIYTGEQNENVFTNDWLGPFWGYKNVVQTFKLTEKPRRLKPIDIYYHFYSGSKKASLNALKYVFNWVLKQDINPMFTSQYIKKVMDYYAVSMAQENNRYLLDGMRDLHTVRFMQNNFPYDKSKTVLGHNIINNETYISLDNSIKHKITKSAIHKDYPYLKSANALVTKHLAKNGKEITHFKGFINIKLTYFIPNECHLRTSAKPIKQLKKDNFITMQFNKKEVTTYVQCR